MATRILAQSKLRIEDRLRGAALGAALLVLLAACYFLAGGSLRDPSSAYAQSPYPARNGVVANGTDLALSEARINRDFDELVGEPHDMDGIVLLVDSCRPDPEVYLDGALVHYGLAPDAGTMYDDVLAWLVCTDPRYVGFFYAAGNPYAAALDQDSVADAMIPQLQAGNFTGAVTSGIEVVSGAMSRAGDQPGESQAEREPLVAQPATGEQPPRDARTSSEEDDGLGWPTRAAGLALLGAGGLGGWWWLRRRRNGGAPATETALPADSTQRELENKLAELDEKLVPGSAELSRLVLAYEALGDAMILDLNRRHLAMVERLAELRREVEALTTGSVPAALADDPEAAEERYAGPMREADELLEYVRGLADEADHVEMLDERAAILVVEAKEAISRGAEEYAAAAGSLELPSAGEAFSFPNELLEEAEDYLAKSDRISAGRLAEEAIELTERITRAANRMSDLDRRIDEVAGLFERFEEYAETSWADLRGNGSEAEESLAAASEMFSRIASADRASFGSDASAGYTLSLERVFDELNRASGLLDAVAERLDRLQQAQLEARDVLTLLRRELDEGRGWLEQPKVDTDVDSGPATQLERAEQVLAEAESAMIKPRPDWLAILRQLSAADRTVDAAIADARQQQDRILALRRQLQAAKTAAGAAVDRAEQFLATHRPDIDETSASRLNVARSAVQRARDHERGLASLEDRALAELLEKTVADYERGTDLADAAYEAMNADFQRAEDRRGAYVPRPDWIGPTVPVPVGRRRAPFPVDIWGWGGGPVARPSRPSRWGGGGKSGGRPSSSRRGGGRGW